MERVLKKAACLWTKIVCLILCMAMSIAFVACAPTEQPEVPGESEYSGADTVSGFTENQGRFYSDYETLDDAHAAGRDINIRLAEEGSILLKNENNALPLNKDERNVTLLGIKSVKLQTGGSGSGAGAPGAYGIPQTTLVQSMEDAGFRVNQRVLSLYERHIGEAEVIVEVDPANGLSQTVINELPQSYYSDVITNSYQSYDDAAIITFSRSGSEGADLLASDVPGHSDRTDHILQLSDDEEALVRHAKQNFEKVIVLINSSNIMEVGELNAPKTDDNLGVDAILWIGHVGNDGAAAVGRILSGEVNPSGRTVDLWSYNFKNDPSWTNFGSGKQVGQDNNVYSNGKDTGFNTVEYREDIYNGYRYYETVAADMNAEEEGSGDRWYAENVVYPFGYGLSYTSFAWELDDSIAEEGAIKSAGSTITMKVKVTNTGDMTGKDVVQVYASQPYYAGGIEKADAILVGYAKTKLLKPGESEVVTVQIIAHDMASFDWSDKNNNSFIGYELEAGDYIISARHNSHDSEFSVTRTIESDILCPNDIDTGKPVFAAFS